MIRPPRGCCAAMARNAAWAHRKVPVRFVSTTRCQSSKADLGDRRGEPEPRVVEQQVDAPVALQRRGEERRDRRRIGDVGGYGEAVARPRSSPAAAPPGGPAATTFQPPSISA